MQHVPLYVDEKNDFFEDYHGQFYIDIIMVGIKVMLIESGITARWWWRTHLIPALGRQRQADF